MELSFAILLGAFAMSYAASGGAWAHAALAPERRIYARGQWAGLGVPSLVGAVLSLLAVWLPQFDVSFAVLIGAAVLCSGAALLGRSATRTAALARGVLWPLAALAYAFALAQAVGIA